MIAYIKSILIPVVTFDSNINRAERNRLFSKTIIYSRKVIK